MKISKRSSFLIAAVLAAICLGFASCVLENPNLGDNCPNGKCTRDMTWTVDTNDGPVTDGGTLPEDGGVLPEDGGVLPEDGGVTEDGGAPEDGGVPEDGGTTVEEGSCFGAIPVSDPTKPAHWHSVRGTTAKYGVRYLFQGTIPVLERHDLPSASVPGDACEPLLKGNGGNLCNELPAYGYLVAGTCRAKFWSYTGDFCFWYPPFPTGWLNAEGIPDLEYISELTVGEMPSCTKGWEANLNAGGTLVFRTPGPGDEHLPVGWDQSAGTPPPPTP